MVLENIYDKIHSLSTNQLVMLLVKKPPTTRFTLGFPDESAYTQDYARTMLLTEVQKACSLLQQASLSHNNKQCISNAIQYYQSQFVYYLATQITLPTQISYVDIHAIKSDLQLLLNNIPSMHKTFRVMKNISQKTQMHGTLNYNTIKTGKCYLIIPPLYKHYRGSFILGQWR